MAAESKGAVLITGAARRIGRAIALDLARHGWAVGIHYNTSRADAEDVARTIRSAGGRAATVHGDLAREEDVSAIVPRAARELGPLACLINNASIFERDSPATATKESWDLHMQVNLRAPFVLVQSFLAQLPAGQPGNVINIIDERVWNLTPHFTSYTVSKAGLWALTQTLALALSPNVRVNAIGPGPTLPSPRQTEEQFKRQWSSIPLGRRVALEEICAAIRFILDAPSMTGQMIALDGGQHLGWASRSAGGGTDE
ncbi:MAG: SDR family oxidoreductase [Rhodospirillales bacterium]|nr:SDR family oxidoreductase [Rhodospirillales bacterium]